MLALLVLASTLPATAAPLSGLHYLVGSWKCVYRAGPVSLAYNAVWAFDRSGHTLQQIDYFAGGTAEELIAYDAKRSWTAVVFDDHGTTTIMRATGSDPNHMAYKSVYPDASIAVTFNRISSTDYDLHARVRAGGKTTTSVDSCLRNAR